MTVVGIERDSALDLNLQPQGSTQVVYYTEVLSHLDLVARNVFAVATPCTVLLSDRGWPRGGAAYTTRESAVGARAGTGTQSASEPVLEAVEDLRAWLNVSYEDLAQILGWQSASVIYHWRQRARSDEPVRPRASSVEPVLRLHALLRAIGETISGENDASVLQSWVRSPLVEGGTTALDLLRAGQIEDVERAASPLIFGSSNAGARDWRILRAETDQELPQQRGTRYSPEDFG